MSVNDSLKHFSPAALVWIGLVQLRCFTHTSCTLYKLPIHADDLLCLQLHTGILRCIWILKFYWFQLDINIETAAIAEIISQRHKTHSSVLQWTARSSSHVKLALRGAKQQLQN
jgi:hypothetical protein